MLALKYNGPMYKGQIVHVTKHYLLKTVYLYTYIHATAAYAGLKDFFDLTLVIIYSCNVMHKNVGRKGPDPPECWLCPANEKYKRLKYFNRTFKYSIEAVKGLMCLASF